MSEFAFEFGGPPEGMSESDWQQLRELAGKANIEATTELVANLEEAWDGRVVLDAASVFVGMMTAYFAGKGIPLVALIAQRPDEAEHFATVIDRFRGSLPTTDEPAAPAIPDVRTAALQVYRLLDSPGGVPAETAVACRRILEDGLYPDRRGV